MLTHFEHARKRCGKTTFKNLARNFFRFSSLIQYSKVFERFSNSVLTTNNVTMLLEAFVHLLDMQRYINSRIPS